MYSLVKISTHNLCRVKFITISRPTFIVSPFCIGPISTLWKHHCLKSDYRLLSHLGIHLVGWPMGGIDTDWIMHHIWHEGPLGPFSICGPLN